MSQMPSMGMTGSDKFALIIGNGDYVVPDQVLELPLRDARSMRMALKRLGYRCFGRPNLSSTQHAEIIDTFLDTLTADCTAVIYLSGHGLQVSGLNYLVPIDFTSSDWDHQAKLLSINELISRTAAQSGICIVFLDVCRDNPLVDKINNIQAERSISKGSVVRPEDLVWTGMADFSASDSAFPGDVFVAFAAEPGKPAWQGTGANSIFTSSLLDYLETADLSLESLMFRVSYDVQEVTGGEQRPTRSTNLREPFFFASGSWMWIAANLINMLAFAVSIFVLALTCYGPSESSRIAAVAVVVLLTFGLFIGGLNRSFQFSKGQIKKSSRQTWARNIAAGVAGSLFAAPIMASSYYLTAVQEIEISFGQILAEITLACVVAGIFLSPLSYTLAERKPWLSGQLPKLFVTISSATMGGLMAGFLVGPPLTIFFGAMARPHAEPWQLLPAGFVGVIAAVFSIITYSYERLNLQRILKHLFVCATAIAIIGGFIFVAFWPAQKLISDAIASNLGDRSRTFLAAIGMVIGPMVGMCLGAAIGLSVYFVEIDPVSGRTHFDQLLSKISAKARLWRSE